MPELETVLVLDEEIKAYICLLEEYATTILTHVPFSVHVQYRRLNVAAQSLYQFCVVYHSVMIVYKKKTK